jgi:hypothetical protein
VAFAKKSSWPVCFAMPTTGGERTRSSNHASQSVSIFFRDRVAEHYQIKVATPKEMKCLSYRLRRRDE